MIYDNNFNDMNDLIAHIQNGCEVEFIYRRKSYGITPIEKGVVVYRVGGENEVIYQSVTEIGEYTIGDKKLSDIISEIKIVFRSF